jgi:ubiquinone biosynthesis UbiH/UbiF/VisC/COQ6 family hydroxylase
VDFDLVVVGAGPVGLGLALAARGLKVAVLARETLERPRRADETWDARVYALSPGNVEFLRAVGAWRAVPPQRATPVHAMRVCGDRPGARIEFDAYEAGVGELAWTLEDAVLQDAMRQAAREAAGVRIIAPAACESLAVEKDAVRVVLGGGDVLHARLVVGADGARSFVREQAGIAARVRDYGQAAVVANFECGKPHAQRALQWFQGGPVLALLPLPGSRVSMIWSLPSTEAARIAALDAAGLCAALEEATAGALGALTLITPARSYPLQRLAARRLVASRVALIGDAAHVIHPLAGQGLNLGLQDARVLGAALRARPRDAGDPGLLRAYERSRAEPILSMDGMVDGLFRLFGSRSKVLGRLRNDGLNLTGQVTVLKNLLMRHAMQ